MMRSETPIELKFLNSSFRAHPLVETRQTVPCRAIRGNSISVNSTLHPLRFGAQEKEGENRKARASKTSSNGRDGGHEQPGKGNGF